MLFLVSAAPPALAQVFGPPQALNSTAASDSEFDASPVIATDGSGSWLAVWYSEDSLGGTIGTDGDLFVARSTDRGATWTAPAVLNTNAATDSKDDYHHHLATDGSGNWLAVWQTYDSLGGTIGTDADILVARSTDHGATWTAPAPLNSNAPSDSAPDRDPRVATDGAGTWVAVWKSYDSLGDTIGTDADIFIARSADDGATWTAAAALNTNAAGDLRGDGYPRIAVDGAGRSVVVWASWLHPEEGQAEYDVFFARSTDGGVTWTAPANIKTDAETDWDTQGNIATDGLGNWLAVWASNAHFDGEIYPDHDLFFARSTDGGATWTSPAVLNADAATDSDSDAFWEDYGQEVASGGDGSWVAVWMKELYTSPPGYLDRAYVATSNDGGATWSMPAPLNPGAASEPHEELPWIASDGAGQWVAAWFSDDPLGGAIGTDFDILFARSPALVPVPALAPSGRVLVALLLVLVAGGCLRGRRGRER